MGWAEKRRKKLHPWEFKSLLLGPAMAKVGTKRQQVLKGSMC